MNQITIFDEQKKEITPQSLEEISYKDVKVITTDLLAMFYQTEPRRITENFSRNTSRFVEGKHYHKLENGELKGFKNQYANSDAVKIPQKTAHLYLWTKRGAARHSKMLGTDMAWDVFDELEEHYFSHKSSGLITIDPTKNELAVLEMLTNKVRQLKQQEPYVMIANNFLEASTLKTVLQVSKELGIGEKTLFRILREQKVFYYTFQNGGKVNLPYERHVLAKRFEVKNKTKEFTRSDGSTGKVNYSQVRVTAKGEAFICMLLQKLNEISAA